MPLATTAPDPSVHSQGLIDQGKLAHGFKRASYPPQPLTTTSNSAMVGIYREATLCQPCALNPG
jgi:hypothetical protein